MSGFRMPMRSSANTPRLLSSLGIALCEDSQLREGVANLQSAAQLFADLLTRPQGDREHRCRDYQVVALSRQVEQLCRLRRWDDAIAVAREGVAAGEKLVAMDSHTSTGRNNYVGLLNNLALTLHLQGHYDEALATRQRELKELERLSRDFPQVDVRQKRAACYDTQAQLLDTLGKQEEAVECFRQGQQIAASLVAEFPENTAYRRGLLIAEFNLANNCKPERRQRYKAAMEHGRKLVEQVPEDATYRFLLAYSQLGYSKELRAGDERRNLQEEAVASLEAMVQQTPIARHLSALATGRSDLGDTLELLDRSCESQECYRLALSDCQRGIDLGRDDPTDSGWRSTASHLHSTCSRLLAHSFAPDLRDPKRAKTHSEQAIELEPSDAWAWAGLAVAHYRLGEYQESLAALEKAEQLEPSCRDEAKHCLWLALARGNSATPKTHARPTSADSVARTPKIVSACARKLSNCSPSSSSECQSHSSLNPGDRRHVPRGLGGSAPGEHRRAVRVIGLEV